MDDEFSLELSICKFDWLSQCTANLTVLGVYKKKKQHVAVHGAEVTDGFTLS